MDGDIVNTPHFGKVWRQLENFKLKYHPVTHTLLPQILYLMIVFFRTSLIFTVDFILQLFPSAFMNNPFLYWQMFER